MDRLRAAGIEPVLVIGSAAPDPSAEARGNQVDLPRLTGCRVIGRVPAAAARLAPADFVSGARSWLDRT